MKEIGIEELKQIQLDILLDVHAFCMDNGIEYILTGGTGIGAIRHKGYIPWDDDIDIAMTRPNYDKFLQSFNGYYKHLEVYAPELDWNYYAPYANVCDVRTIVDEPLIGHNGYQIGIKIDVFPIDGVLNEAEYLTRRKICGKCNYRMGVKRRKLYEEWKINKKKCIYYLGLKLLMAFIPYSYFQKKIYREATKYQFSDAPFASPLTFPNSKPLLYRKDWFDNYIDVEFEGKKVRFISRYDDYLKELFGNYMELPPEEQRVAHHGFRAYWKE